MLQIYIAQHCWGCDEALAIGHEAAQRFPRLRVEIVDLDEEGARRPEEVIAVPTFLLEDRVISLGNPKREWLFERIAQSLERGA